MRDHEHDVAEHENLNGADVLERSLSPAPPRTRRFVVVTSVDRRLAAQATVADTAAEARSYHQPAT